MRPATRAANTRLNAPFVKKITRATPACGNSRTNPLRRLQNPPLSTTQ